MDEDSTLLSSETELPEELEDDLTGSATLEFERLHGIGYGENSALVPSVNAFDLPVLDKEEFETLVKKSARRLSAADLVTRSAARVVAFDQKEAAHVTAFALRILNASEATSKKR
ncbi:hypothetical protein [Mycolicibacterium grossiae]|uniref:hypothetical protein n=1 Tax=Mycolicibacterium grossiae TaxID=1552759 RepID=UPI000F770CBD|nr:hypothetical protein [Mycolicibacterium grossiae]QEM43666.1 hypothetical protein FZ046_01755 [Mycolicibacterium grossiae]